jgi:hypothetical protein
MLHKDSFLKMLSTCIHVLSNGSKKEKNTDRKQTLCKTEQYYWEAGQAQTERNSEKLIEKRISDTGNINYNPFI